MARDNPHGCDPVTGNCPDCGATREMIDDGIVPTCRKFEGPHRRALVILNRYLMYSRSHIDCTERELRRAEDRVVYLQRNVREARESERELSESVEFLASESKPTLPIRLPDGRFTFFTPPGE